MSAGDDRDAMEQAKPIGGFLGLDLAQIPETAGSVWEAWTRPFKAVSTFGVSRTALAALIRTSAPRRVWLPAYFCGEATPALQAAAAAVQAEVRSYRLTEDLDPDVETLAPDLASGDLVVVVDYFGWPPGRAFRDWAATRADVVWVEDRAQTLWTADPPWAPWCVYSPRKLVGTPNGGLLLGPTSVAPDVPAPSADLSVALPEMMRFEDIGERRNDRWYAAYLERESAFARAPGVMSQFTGLLLRRIPIAGLVQARQRNYRYLLGRLPDLAAWPRPETDVAPFGLVIAVEDAADLARQLAEQRLFCPRHWADLGSDPASFPYEHRLSRQLLTLPCDHRYGPQDLERLVDAVERLSPAPAGPRQR